MGSVPVFYWPHFSGVTQQSAALIAQALTAAGHQPIEIDIKASHEKIIATCQQALDARPLPYSIAITPGALEQRVGDAFFWERLDGTLFVLSYDSPFYYMNNPAFWQLMRSPNAARVVYLLIDGAHLEPFRAVLDAVGSASRAFFLPLGAPKSGRRFLRHAERVHDVTFFGSIDRTIAQVDPYRGLEASLADLAFDRPKLDALNAQLERALTAREPLCILDWYLDAIRLTARDLVHDAGALAGFQKFDSYIKAQRRLKIVGSLAGHSVSLFGSGWERLAETSKSFKLFGEVAYADQFNIFAASQFALNIDPNIAFGAHDRVPNAMICGAAVATEANPFTRGALQNGRDAILYAPSGEGLADQIAAARPRYLDIAANGAIWAGATQTWASRVAFMESVVATDRRVFSVEPLKLN